MSKRESLVFDSKEELDGFLADVVAGCGCAAAIREFLRHYDSGQNFSGAVSKLEAQLVRELREALGACEAA